MENPTAAKKSGSQYEFPEYTYTHPDEIITAVFEVIDSQKQSQKYVSPREVLDQMSLIIKPANRAEHIGALALLKTNKISHLTIVETIIQRLEDWRDINPSIDDWANQYGEMFLSKHLSGFSDWPTSQNSLLWRYFRINNMRGDEALRSFLRAIEANIDSLSARTILQFVGFASQFCQPTELSKLILWYSERLLNRIPDAEQDLWDLSDIPEDSGRAIVRIIYALMSDVDLRIRWRALHAFKTLVFIENDSSIIELILNEFDRYNEDCFRDPHFNFYWLAARLWLVIGLFRISGESPKLLESSAERIFSIATDNEFPHCLLQEFAKRTLMNLIDLGIGEFSKKQIEQVKSINSGRLDRVKLKPREYAGYDRMHHNQENRQFHFDSSDTLPYWYQGANRLFPEVDNETFLDIAENWIVEKWKISSNPWKWDDELRSHRFTERHYPMWRNDHGSLPTIERFSTHLEWHAMWCTMGQLLETSPLVDDSDENYWGTIEDLIQSNFLTNPPHLLADFHSAKPLQRNFWHAPSSEIDDWIEQIVEKDFMCEIINESYPEITVASNHEIISKEFNYLARIRSALVSPTTAASLARALQVAEDSWDYRLPDEQDNSEIAGTTFQLLGWLQHNDSIVELEQDDPLRYELGPPSASPGDIFTRTISLVIDKNSLGKWISTSKGNVIFAYKAWGDYRDREIERQINYDNQPLSNGWRLRINTESLESFLEQTGYDLILEVEITKRKVSNDRYKRYDKKESKSARYDRVYLLRRSGDIETSNGVVGAWAPHRETT